MPVPESARREPRCLVGTAGWADRDLIESGWYPAEVRSPAERLAYYADRFALVEVDSPFYAIPGQSAVLGWAQSSPSGFVMDVKAYSLLTGHRTRTATLPPDLRELAEGARIAAGSATKELLDATWQWFHAAVEPLRQAGRLGLVLMQFPPTCRAEPQGLRRVEEALSLCAPLQAAVEFRHDSWLDAAHRDRALALLRAYNAAFVCVGMPQSQSHAMPPDAELTADKAVIRLHGHSAMWADGGKEARYRYEYTEAELAAWAERAQRLSRSVDEVHIVVNTCCAGAAQRAAARLREFVDPIADDTRGDTA
jgi:uncharacterized protein YecE (DUF72 family)